MERKVVTECSEENTIRGLKPSGIFLNCYEILNPREMAWQIRTYTVIRTDGHPQAHEDRGGIKNAIWELRKLHKDRCNGFGFVVDVDERTVAVPATWGLPSGAMVGAYRVTLERTFITNETSPVDRPIITGIIREAVKKHFKDNVSEELGDLWQNYNDFCQMPEDTNADYHFCRRFGAAAKVLRNNLWVLRLQISTATLDGNSFADYYRSGTVSQLASMIEAKRANRLTRKNRPVAIRVWRNESTEYQLKVSVIELEDPSTVFGHGTLPRQEQISLARKTIRCRPFKGPPIDVPRSEIRLILDSQITQENHGDTIIETEERESLMRQLRNFLDGADLYGHPLLLAQTPVDADDFPMLSIRPPSIRVRNKTGGDIILEAPALLSEESLKQRGRARSDHLRQHGFLQYRPIHPLLALPHRLGAERARRMNADLNHIWEWQGIGYRFDWFLYDDVEHLRKKIEQDGYDALLAVLPEGSNRPHYPDNTHEKIKRLIEVPSQCIQHDHTLPEAWVGRLPKEFRRDEPKLAHLIRERYTLCLGNLLVKHHWIPFAPADAFYYNTQVGLDVGGRHNNRAMTCLGHGFQRPEHGLIFRPEEIPIDVQKAEPIPTDCLYRGLLHVFEFVHAELSSANVIPDFERSIFYRDGPLLGDGDEWNERDDLFRLHAELLRRDWITRDSVWTAVEILKLAEGWRLFQNDNGVRNPVVGRCVFPYDDEYVGLVCTTGAPYLSQGTANPLKVHIIDIYGCHDRNEVMRDLLWQADLCFSKPDIGMALPWVLHVANTGALQSSRSYKVSGITL